MKINEDEVFEGTTDFEGFLRDNRYKVNASLNKILWICILVGPAIALGILGGVFKNTTYMACVIISCVMALVAGTNFFILRKTPYSYVPGVLALVAVDILLCFMNCSHISIRLTWFLVPFLSLLFSDRKVYISTSILNYIIMGVGTWLEASHYAAVRTDFDSPLIGFINVFAGCTIEAIIMFAAGYALGKATNNYYRKIIGQNAETAIQKQTLQEQLKIMESMAEIYDCVNLIDFTESTEMSLREDKLQKLAIEQTQDHTQAAWSIKDQIVPDMAEDFWRFTDIRTVPMRLVNRKIVAGEFINNDTGWFRAQFIRVTGKDDQRPDVVIFTMQNIDADKRREEHLIRLSRTDELTRLYNRHGYEEDISEIREKGVDDDLILISADINGLKTVNDNLGHAAGDELIKGAAYCLLSAVGSIGKIYRTGGDEFIAIVHSSDCKPLVDMIKANTERWHGKLVKTVSVSVGCASRAENPDAGIEELERLADMNMYKEKEDFYRNAGLEIR